MVALLVVIAFVGLPGAVLSASIASRCPIESSYCKCGSNQPFYSVQCAGIDEVETFQEVVSNLTAGAVIMEVDAVNWTSLPLSVMNQTSLQTLIVGNSTFRRLHDVSNESQAVDNLRHLSLENVTFEQVPRWKEFSRLLDLRVLFLFNTTMPNSITSSFGRHMSKSLRSLTVSDSDVEAIENGSFVGMRNLTHIRISHSRLRSFSESAFDEQSNLEQLRLDYNKIESLPPGFLETFPNLKLLSLSNNTISSLPENVFAPLWRRSMYLELRGNPIKCDCSMLWAIKSTTKPRNVVGECALPKNLFGKKIKELTEGDLNC